MSIRKHLISSAAICALSALAAPAHAQLVTYSWTTTSQGFGPVVGQPSAASFQVALGAVQTGRINLSDIVNIQLAYPGLTLDSFAASSGGLDHAAFVDPVTGALTYQSPDQGLSVIGYEGGLFSTSFLSITVGNRYTPFGEPLISVADQFNALKNGSPIAGFRTAGYWTAQLPQIDAPIPEPASWALLIAGFAVIGSATRRRRQLRLTFA